MSAHLKIISLLAAVQIHAYLVIAQGTVIANDAAILPLFGSGQYLTLTNSIDSSQGRYGLFAIQISSGGGSQFTFSYAGIAEEYALYSVTPGTVIDPAFATLTTPLVSNNNNPGSSVQTFLLGQSSYFGYWDDRQLSGSDPGVPNTPDMYDNYGGVVITRTAAGLQVSSSVTALGGGIIAGTLTQTPEPSVSLLVLLGLCLAFGVRWFCIDYTKPPNQSPEQTAVGACRSAVAVHVTSRRWLSFFR